MTPIFPLNTVVFPGMVLPLHIFEARYRHMMRDLMSLPEPEQRRFVVLAIRDGYEVGEFGSQSLYSTGTLVQLGDTQQNPDGSLDIEVRAIARARVATTQTGSDYLRGNTEIIPESTATPPAELVNEAKALFQRYQGQVHALSGFALYREPMPVSAVELSFTLATSALLPLPHKQCLLEESDVAQRLRLWGDYITEELAAMRAIPSLPATELARTRWSPN
ncbi:MAG TPA: LON peptidase substrate-binding domain-containing protein [Marmoricola sp.]|nr:LON peptidase substrate-binding domain-containing protein [Marmoricola sp.]